VVGCLIMALWRIAYALVQGRSTEKSCDHYRGDASPDAPDRGRTRITAKIYHKPIEPLHRPIEGVTAEAKVGVRNA
jgi:hypothetical protein